MPHDCCNRCPYSKSDWPGSVWLPGQSDPVMVPGWLKDTMMEVL